MRNFYLAATVTGAIALMALSQAYAASRPMNAARAAAIHECSVLAGRYPETTFGSTEFQLYRACMARHGEME